MLNEESYTKFKESTKYVLHPSNQIKKLKKPLEQHTTDVAKTINKYRREK